jgi:hypothetical protein
LLFGIFGYPRYGLDGTGVGDVGGKGTPRRKAVRTNKSSAGQDDRKLQAALKKLNMQPIPGVEELNMFREDGNVLHFSAPKGMFSHFHNPNYQYQCYIFLISYSSC